MYTPGATNCVNTYSDKTCESLYAIAAANPAPVPGLKTLRPGKCFTTAATAAVTSPIDADLVRAAVSTCPKTCGYCCQSPDYNCPNVQCKIFIIQNLRNHQKVFFSPTSQLRHHPSIPMHKSTIPCDHCSRLSICLWAL